MAALLEFDSKQQRGKVEKAEEAIVRRIQELAFAKGGESELRLLHDGLSIIRQLKERLAQPSTNKLVGTEKEEPISRLPSNQ